MGIFTPQIQDWIFATEGGYVDHPKDPGGATNMGITFRVLQAWYGRPITKNDVRNMPKSVAVQIYEKNYWNAVRAGQLPVGVDYAVFDYAVNSGVSRALKDLQRTLGGLYRGTIDGIAGTLTLDAVRAYVEAHGAPALIRALCERRWNFVSNLSTFSTFGTGWRRRIWGAQMGVQVGDTGVADRATKLALNTAQNVPMPEESQGHAFPEENTIMDGIKDPGVLTAIGGFIATIVGAVANQPILQVALIAGVAFLIYRFIIVKKKVDPA